MKYILIALLILGTSSTAHAVPVLQVGAPGGPSEGAYADYISNPASPPAEENTAITNGTIIYAGGVYGSNVVNLGGMYGSGDDWSSFGFDSSFNGRGAILLVSVPEGTLSAALSTLKISVDDGGSVGAFYSSSDTSFFTNNHAPLHAGVSDFLFFDLGSFINALGAVPDFDTESGSGDGQIKKISLYGLDDLAWVHFDTMAIETSVTGKNLKTTFDVESNPGSHDVTWKHAPVPEPSTFLLLGAGLLGLGFYSRRCKKA